MTDTPPLPKSPEKDLPRPLQAGDRALNQADLAGSEEFQRWATSKGLVSHQGRFRRSERDRMARGYKSGRAMKGRR